jgi:hypothetical protein
MRAEDLPVDRVERGPVREIGDVHRRLHDVVEAAPGSFEDGGDIGEHLARLLVE